MEPILATLISKSRNGRRAQVVVWVGEGSARRSITCHIHLANGRWTGHHPDKEEVARLDAAEAAERRADYSLKSFETALALAEKALRRLEDRKEKIDPVEYAASCIVLKIAHSANADERDSAVKFAGDAKKAADEVRAEVAREPEFVF